MFSASIRYLLRTLVYTPDGSHDGQPTAVSAHDFNHKSTRMGRGSRGDGIHSVADSVKSCSGANGQVGAGHVVIDAPDSLDSRSVSAVFGIDNTDADALCRALG